MTRTNNNTPRAFLAGVLAVNSIGHLATAVAGKEHLTPLRGRRSGPATNAVWGGANLVAGLALAHAVGGPERRWGPELNAFAAGAAGFATWMFISELVIPLNTKP